MLDDAARARCCAETFGFHELTLRACRERNHVPSTHAYPDYLFVVLHAPGDRRHAGTCTCSSSTSSSGGHYLVTVHGPINPDVPLERALVETRAALRRIEEGRLRPGDADGPVLRDRLGAGPPAVVRGTGSPRRSQGSSSG